jgi:hypothetical protein
MVVPRDQGAASGGPGRRLGPVAIFTMFFVVCLAYFKVRAASRLR